MRWVGVLVFLAGLVLSFGSESIFKTSIPREIARATVYEDGIARAFGVNLDASQAPLIIKLVVTVAGRYDWMAVGDVVTLNATTGSTTLVMKGVSLNDMEALPTSSAGQYTYSTIVSSINAFKTGRYVFVVAERGLSGIRLKAVELVLDANTITEASDHSTIGMLLMWLGAALFVLGLRRRNRVDPNVPAAPSKWGRGN